MLARLVMFSCLPMWQMRMEPSAMSWLDSQTSGAIGGTNKPAVHRRAHRLLFGLTLMGIDEHDAGRGSYKALAEHML